jgi:membrane protein YdbS with pleckstrin-like domain
MVTPDTARSQPGAVLSDRPVIHRALTYVVGSVLAFIIFLALFMISMMQADPGDSSWTWVSGIGSICLLFAIIGLAAEYARLHSERYIVTTDSIEVRSGILRRDARKIPLSHVLDITSNASFDRRLFGVGNITVAIANGDCIILEDVTDAERKTETLWNLVHKK